MTSAGPGSCDHIGFFTNNPTRLVEFYCDNLGFRVGRDEVLSASIMRAVFGFSHRCRMIRLDPAAAGGGSLPDAVKIEIFHPLGVRLSRRRNGAVGCNHFGFRPGDRMRFLRTLRSRGVPHIEVRRNGRSVHFIRDPDGNRIEIRD